MWIQYYILIYPLFVFGQIADDYNYAQETTTAAILTEDDYNYAQETTTAAVLTEDDYSYAQETTTAATFTEDDYNYAQETTTAAILTEDDYGYAQETTTAATLTEEDYNYVQETTTGSILTEDDYNYAQETTAEAILTEKDYNYVQETTTAAILAEGEKKMSEYILDVLEHFQDPDPVGVPGGDIPEPISAPDTRKSFGLTTLNFKETAIYGLSKFRIKYVYAEIGSMKITANMTLDSLEAKGTCVANSFWSEVRSPYSIKLTGINATGLATLGITREGKLTAQDIVIEMSFQSVSMSLNDGGALGFLISSFVNTGGNFLFESIKPYMMEEAHTKARESINKKLDEIAGDIEFPNSISPLDMVIIDSRKKVRAMKMDPFKMEDYNSSIGIFSAALSNTWITGLSSFKRVGNISLALENNTVVADFEIGTEQLEGRTQWTLSAINGMISRVGTASFSVKYLNGRIILAQPVDTRKKPQFIDLKLDVGNIQIRSDGAGTMDYIIECAVNILPNLLRYQIVTVLETPMRWKIQQELNEFNVEEAIKQGLPVMDEIQRRGFKLSELRAIKEETIEDDFFNF